MKSLNKIIEELVEENQQLKEEVEYLKRIIQDEEDWKLLKLEELEDYD